MVNWFCFAVDVKFIVGRPMEILGLTEHKAGVLTTEPLHFTY